MKRLFVLIACFGFMALQAQNPGVSKQDRAFAEEALEANLWEMKLSQLAVNKGFAPEVKELAQRMAEDHKKADDLLRQLASERSITAPSQLTFKQQDDYKKMSDKEGEAFDKAYTECMLKDHKKTISLYEKETKKGENTELRAFATNALPALNLHRNLADETCKKLQHKKK